LENKITSVLGTFTHSFHLVKYQTRRVIAALSQRAMVSGHQDWDKIVISSAYKASWESGGSGISAIYREKRVVDRTAPYGSLAGGG
jgi:predicted nucleic acid-binding protein